MLEDKFNLLLEVIYNLFIFITLNLQNAKKKGIKISSPKDNDQKNENESINEFSELISRAHTHIKNIETQIGQLITLKNRIFNSLNEEQQDLSKKVEKIITYVLNIQIKMDKIIKELKSDLYSNKDTSELRTNKNLFDAMINKYQNVIQRFQVQEIEIKKLKENKLIRAAEISLDQELNEKQKSEIIENPQMIKQIYANHLKGKAHVKLQNAVEDLEQRHKDILKLQKSILELHKMIVELSLLVDYQGEMIDNIVDNINQAKDNIIKGEKEINKAHEKMKKPFFKFF